MFVVADRLIVNVAIAWDWQMTFPVLDISPLYPFHPLVSYLELARRIVTTVAFLCSNKRCNMIGPRCGGGLQSVCVVDDARNIKGARWPT